MNLIRSCDEQMVALNEKLSQTDFTDHEDFVSHYVGIAEAFATGFFALARSAEKMGNVDVMDTVTFAALVDQMNVITHYIAKMNLTMEAGVRIIGLGEPKPDLGDWEL